MSCSFRNLVITRRTRMLTTLLNARRSKLVARLELNLRRLRLLRKRELRKMRLSLSITKLKFKLRLISLKLRVKKSL